MKRKEFKPRILGKQLWCSVCIGGKPPSIKKADFLIPKREGHYCLSEDGNSIDNKVVGICKECLKSRNKFQRENTQPVDVDHPHIVLRNI
jgi:hypothetical protein|tara:strand:- start:162 stop:431 length:270 start_codon:yes stop_codon:yes gene_type:complete